MGDHVLFFYGTSPRDLPIGMFSLSSNLGAGTLMAPQVLHRVIHGRADPEPWQKNMLNFQPAVLYGYRRHRVRHADYPGIVPVPSSDSPSTSVLGTLVSGITDGDIYRLDQFEGSEYSRQKVRVRILRGPASGNSSAGVSERNSQPEGHLQDTLDAAVTKSTDEANDVEAVTYVWISAKDNLEETEWDFETFKRDKMAWWVGAHESEW
ncbi:hypothetical protein N7492_000599 [Penicillium capsulatum]|uniref:Putative gamma-glutamylcyclotransferase n=1 Tax=Penicillium capsulatum TaxID=69766 RepID=A0A9W9IPV0_9EURO|nr:hypothetical protein N7492_000599 [Penicillium capsulatum]KAJ6130343.1 hypothetical protein N7512_003123 [Penicillium capsulatum]